MGTDTWSGPTRWRRVLVVAGVVLLAAVLAVAALSRAGDDQVAAVAGTPSASPTASLTAGWVSSEEHPSCGYDSQARTVSAEVAIDGHAPRPESVTVTVTAYADENTSRPVGSGSRRVHVEGAVHVPLHVTFPVDQAPLVDIDGVVACGISLDD